MAGRLEGGGVEVPLFELAAADVALVDDAVHGCLVMQREPDGTITGGRLGYRPGLLVDDLRMLGEWATVRVGRFLEHGPEPDGWQRRSDGGWQIWARAYQLPPID